MFIRRLLYSQSTSQYSITMEPRDMNPGVTITNDILQLGQSYTKIDATELRYNEPRYYEIPEISNSIHKP